MPDTDVASIVEACISSSGQPSELEAAVAAGGDVNASKAKGGSAPLMRAVQAQRADIVSTLLWLKADPNAPDQKGVSPLHMAIFDGGHELVQHLIDAKADVDQRDRHGQTPLFFAPHRKACAQLGKASCDVNVLNFKGQSALHLAGHAGLNDAVLWLAEHMSAETINAQDRHGRTAVYCAAHSNLKSTIMLLQDHGADVSIRPHKYTAVKERERAKRLRSEGQPDDVVKMATALTAAGVGQAPEDSQRRQWTTAINRHRRRPSQSAPEACRWTPKGAPPTMFWR